MLKVAFRVDASTSIGTGHVMRCLTLADGLRASGATVVFLCRAHPDNSIGMLRDRGFTVHELPVQSDGDSDLAHSPWLGSRRDADAADCISLLGAEAPIDWLVVDHYALDARWERALRRRAPRILVIDDLADRDHDCDVLLDINDEDAARYVRRVPRECRLLLGPRYALLRAEFTQAASLRVRPRHAALRRVLIMFGGIDQANDTLAAAQAVAALDADLQTDVVVPLRNPHRDAIVAWCKDRPGFTVHLAPQRPSQLMASADLAIGAGGITTFERLFLGLPALVRPVAANQEPVLAAMSRRGYFTLYHRPSELAALLRQRLANGVESPPPVVANGTPAVVRLLLDDAVQLRNPRALDLRRVFRWLQDPQLRTDFMMARAPERRGHFDYWRAVLEDATQIARCIVWRGRHVGMCGLKNLDSVAGRAELWIYLGTGDVRGQGVGRAAVIRLLEEFRARGGRNVYLHLRRDNEAALALYRGTRFVEARGPLGGRWAGREAEMLRLEVEL